MLQANEEKDKDLNKAFFVYGTLDELKQKQIVESKTTFFSGKRAKLANGFFKNRSYFTELDIRETKEVPISGKKPKVLTTHPVDSYELKENGEKYSVLSILDQKEFWSTSRVLVIEVR